jgi:SAM-dependent methyltransferase
MDMSHYDNFAEHYDAVVGEREDVAVFLQKLLRQYAPRAKTLLELGCGSGSMLKLLSRRYKARGIDLSARMIEVAKKKAPKAKVSVGDITKFSFDERYDAIICPFDTINHVTSFPAWKRVFANAHRHLNPGGVFIFDVNTEAKMERYATEPVFAEIMEDEVSIVDVQRIRRFRYLVNLRLFRRVKGEVYRNHEVLIPELVVPTKQILTELSKYFRRVTMVDPDRKSPTEETEELFFVCQGPR